MAHGLTKKQTLFVSEYLVDLIAGRAAERAGYRNARTSDVGYKNLRNPKIRAAITKVQTPHLARLGVDAERLVTELVRIATANLLDYMTAGADGALAVDFGRINRDHGAVLSEVTVEVLPQARDPERRGSRKIRFRLRAKIGAIRELAQLLGRPREAPDPAEAPRHDPRQVARAVIAILEEAAEAEDAGGYGAPREGAEAPAP
jgi:phage terminase small subunit